MINVGETVKLTARPFNWDGVIDGGASVSFVVEYPDNTTSPSAMAWDAMAAAFVGTYLTAAKGKHTVRITATLTDGSKSVESRIVEVKS